MMKKPWITEETAATIVPGTEVKVKTGGRWHDGQLWFAATGTPATRSTVMWILTDVDMNGSDCCKENGPWKHSFAAMLRELDQAPVFGTESDPYPGPEDVKLASDRRRSPGEYAEGVCARCGRRHENLKEVLTEDGMQPWCPECASHAYVCANCGRLHSAGAGESVEGAHWCDWCCDMGASFCDRCHTWHPQANTALVCVRDTVEVWCKSCAESSAALCERCGDLVPKETLVTIDGHKWCAPCANSYAHTCEECGAVTGAGEQVDGMWLCAACRARRPAAGYIFHYHGGPDVLRFNGGADCEQDRKLFMGFELEAGNATRLECYNAAKALYELDKEYQHYHLEHDGSIPNYGFELVSMPHTLEAHRAYDWKRILKLMMDKGLKSHDATMPCGLHVHVSRGFFTGADLAKLDLFVMNNRNYWERLARRTETTYAKFFDKDEGNAGKDAGRYSAINFAKSKTVEFRLFRGTLRYSTFMATLELVDAVCRWVKTRSCSDIVGNRDGEFRAFVSWMNSSPATYKLALAYAAAKFENTPIGELAAAADGAAISDLRSE